MPPGTHGLNATYLVSGSGVPRPPPGAPFRPGSGASPGVHASSLTASPNLPDRCIDAASVGVTVGPGGAHEEVGSGLKADRRAAKVEASVPVFAAGGAMEAIFAVILSIVANLVYFDMRRSGEHGFKRFLAFWLGSPVSFLTLLLVPEGRTLPVRGDDEGLNELVDEIRQDRESRRLGEPAAPPGSVDRTAE